jgi:hypothetical protein
MKRLLLLTFLFTHYAPAFAAVKTWVGSSGGNWNTAANWAPSGVPVAGDDVLFNSSVNVVIDAGISPVSVNSIHFINNAVVVFQTSVTTNFRLFSTSVLNPALLIEAGSVFTFDAVNAGTNNSTLDLTVATGVVGDIFGTLNISCTGGANNGPKLDTHNSAIAYGIVTVHTGGAIRILPNADNTESSLTPVPTFIMQSGSVYENLKNGGSFPAGNWSPTSLARAISTGTNAPVFNGNLYGNLEWNMPGQTSQLSNFFNKDITFNDINLISTNNANTNGELRIRTGASAGIFTLTVNGNLFVGIDARLVAASSTVTAGNGGYIAVKGNVINNGTITSKGIAGTLNDFLIAGNTPQIFSSTGTFSGGNLLFTMMNSAGLTLLTPLVLPWNADLVAGKITTTAANILTMIDNAVYTGGSANSFINGPMRKIGDEDFIFPVGKGSIYAPASLTGGSGATSTDIFTAEYIRNNPQNVYGNVYEILAPPNNIDHISFVEYWTITRDAGTAGKFVTLTVNCESFNRNFNTLFVTGHDGTEWKNLLFSVRNNTGSCPPNVTGTITTAAAVSNFSPFTLATSEPFTNNPLPINLISFDAVKETNERILVKWELSGYSDATVKFEIEKAGADKIFKSIGKLTGSTTNRFYNYYDNDFKTEGIIYYRLKITNVNGKISYGPTAVIVTGKNEFLLNKVSPNPVKVNMMLHITAGSAGLIELQIVDIQGKILRKWKQALAEGNNFISVQQIGIPGGLYFVTGRKQGSRSQTLIFIKQ